MANPLTSLVVRGVAAAASRQIASRVAGANLGPIGTAATVALPFVLRRVSPLGMVAMAVGAWGVGRLAKSGLVESVLDGKEPQRQPTVTPPPIAWSAAGD
jgi:hypothetical protein